MQNGRKLSLTLQGKQQTLGQMPVGLMDFNAAIVCPWL
jgi:hypothetical protein